MEQAIDLIFVVGFIGLVVLLLGLRQWQKKHSKLTDKQFALILIGYWSFLTAATFYPLLKINFQVAIIVEIVLLLVWWGIGYPWARWLYRRFTSSKK